MTNRYIALDGAYNFRDLGGYPAMNGKQTASGVFYRSDSLHQLSTKDQQRLIEMGLNAVIDLRNGHEVSHQPNSFASVSEVNYHPLPVFSSAIVSSERQVPFRLDALYIYIVDYCHPALKLIFQQLLDAQHHCTVFHCKAGKDRTGVVSAILLDLVGVPHEIIVEDYLVTESNIAPLMEQLRESRPPGVSPEAYEPLLETRAEYIEALLSHLKNHYRGSYGYLQHLGLTDAEIQTLQAKFITD
jgi:protein-tyrosine phosphatase